MIQTLTVSCKLYELYHKNFAIKQWFGPKNVLTHMKLGANVLRIKDDKVEKTRRFQTKAPNFSIFHFLF